MTATVKYSIISSGNKDVIAAAIKAQLEDLAPGATDKFGFAIKDDTLYTFKVTT